MQYLTILGNLGADAQVQVSNEKKFVSFKVADTQRFTDTKGVPHERTTWVSCAWNGDGGNLLPYLKKGTKVLVSGRPSYKTYSSEKERMIVAGVDLHVTSIELAGGSSDSVPSRLVDPNTGAIVNVGKFYWVAGYQSCVLYGEKGGQFQIDARGYVMTSINNNEEAVTPAEQIEVFGEANEIASKMASVSKTESK